MWFYIYEPFEELLQCFWGTRAQNKLHKTLTPLFKNFINDAFTPAHLELRVLLTFKCKTFLCFAGTVFVQRRVCVILVLFGLFKRVWGEEGALQSQQNVLLVWSRSWEFDLCFLCNFSCSYSATQSQCQWTSATFRLRPYIMVITINCFHNPFCFHIIFFLRA